jgi:hypothetical protein
MKPKQQDLFDLRGGALPFNPECPWLVQAMVAFCAKLAA